MTETLKPVEYFFIHICSGLAVFCHQNFASFEVSSSHESLFAVSIDVYYDWSGTSFSSSSTLVFSIMVIQILVLQKTFRLLWFNSLFSGFIMVAAVIKDASEQCIKGVSPQQISQEGNCFCQESL